MFSPVCVFPVRNAVARPSRKDSPDSITTPARLQISSMEMPMSSSGSEAAARATEALTYLQRPSGSTMYT